MEVRTRYWGVVEVEEDRVVHFPEGIPGFPEARRFALLGEPGGVFLWLQSVDCPEVALPVADPFTLFENYEVPLDPEDVELLSVTSPQEVAVLVVVTVRSDPLQATANLAAPILVNTNRRLGRQKVLADASYSVRHPLFTTA
ncbi:MAG: flagellar assembly protein FliW [Armatimonadota bacterium]|nr:flagellar assembly protein FliW [Armatimonadota bacterium]MDR7392638.1 flagellar assembly protein FliW [Armatimonadota bacterium]MDR7396630.1 flagellar assembly protein FliW [Armatimonadota bacterium]MDR7399051.1 flagellar assembly protein FliW [Armatimonadota bacterium]MDR7405787.1 flagellar assembly protein FliW [Armatimonadota bacterium]